MNSVNSNDVSDLFGEYKRNIKKVKNYYGSYQVFFDCEKSALSAFEVVSNKQVNGSRIICNMRCTPRFNLNSPKNNDEKKPHRNNKRPRNKKNFSHGARNAKNNKTGAKPSVNNNESNTKQKKNSNREIGDYWPPLAEDNNAANDVPEEKDENKESTNETILKGYAEIVKKKQQQKEENSAQAEQQEKKEDNEAEENKKEIENDENKDNGTTKHEEESKEEGQKEMQRSSEDAISAE